MSEIEKTSEADMCYWKLGRWWDLRQLRLAWRCLWLVLCIPWAWDFLDSQKFQRSMKTLMVSSVCVVGNFKSSNVIDFYFPKCLRWWFQVSMCIDDMHLYLYTVDIFICTYTYIPVYTYIYMCVICIICVCVISNIISPKNRAEISTLLAASRPLCAEQMPRHRSAPPKLLIAARSVWPGPGGFGSHGALACLGMGPGRIRC